MTKPRVPGKFTAEYNSRGTVDLYFGEALVFSWPIPPGAGDLQVAWRRDKFVAEQLAEIFHLAYEQEE